ncbi:MAG: hypothetical protein IH874_05265 [Candidatus Dadabacteria bacterium]|nr:hypothetical protein [Candidatus Dadabacteria bacterium]
MGLSKFRRFVSKSSLRFKLLILSLSFVSCAAGLLALLSPKLLPLAAILVVPGGGLGLTSFEFAGRTVIEQRKYDPTQVPNWR